MADDTDWSTLKAKCTDHNTSLILRAETFEGDFRFALSAVDKYGAVIYDIRQNAEDHAPQFIITQLVTQALGDWWE